MDSLIDIPPEENPENMPSATEELLQIMEDFADYIDKFMFEIVTLLAVTLLNWGHVAAAQKGSHNGA